MLSCCADAAGCVSAAVVTQIIALRDLVGPTEDEPFEDMSAAPPTRAPRTGMAVRHDPCFSASLAHWTCCPAAAPHFLHASAT